MSGEARSFLCMIRLRFKWLWIHCWEIFIVLHCQCPLPSQMLVNSTNFWLSLSLSPFHRRDHGLVRAMEVLTGEGEEGEERGTPPTHQVLSYLLKGLLWLQHTYTRLSSGTIQVCWESSLLEFSPWSHPMFPILPTDEQWGVDASLCRQSSLVSALDMYLLVFALFCCVFTTEALDYVNH